ncbi:Exosome complex component MTR3 [Glycine soja]|uniref:Exosome complex component MTR3 n=1 Tax=Glycine soja TaxID=3848 RepID=A0A0B2P8Z9_GLYSO|nr:Exosome complex component MTR3 [Glycine soja]
MAGKGGSTPATYSPSPTTDKKKPSLFNEDLARPDGRSFHQCRPAFFVFFASVKVFMWIQSTMPFFIVMAFPHAIQIDGQMLHNAMILFGEVRLRESGVFLLDIIHLLNLEALVKLGMPKQWSINDYVFKAVSWHLAKITLSQTSYISVPDFHEMEALKVRQVQTGKGHLLLQDPPMGEFLFFMLDVCLLEKGIGTEIPDVVHCAVFRTGAVNAASGSAYAEVGNTKVIVSVFGPRESKKAMMYSDIGRLNCNVSFTTFATPIRGQGSDHKEYSSMLHKALEGAIILETFPKTTVDVFALVLESSGSDLPVVISCASLALADAGIMMYDLVASVSVSCFNKNLVIDPVLEEENGQDGSLMITCMPSRYEITQLTVTGECTVTVKWEWARARWFLTSGCCTLLLYFQSCITISIILKVLEPCT